MSASDSEQTMDEQMPVVVKEMAPEVEQMLRQGEAVLTGKASVQLYFDVEDAPTPQDAVERVIRTLAHSGLYAVTFAVTDDETGQDYLVRAGQVITQGQLEAEVEQRQDEDERA